MGRPALLVPREKLILWSVCALHQRAGQATDAPMKPDFGIKLALELLHAFGCERAHVDDFWRAMRAEHSSSIPKGQASYVRGCNLTTAIEGIMRSLKVDDALFRHELHEAIHGKSPHVWTPHERLLDHLRHEREERAERKRRRADCGWL